MTKTMTREEFFLGELVPTGQMLELVLTAIALWGLADSRSRPGLFHELRDPLNLVASWAANPRNNHFDTLAVQTTAARQAMARMFDSLGGRREDVVVALYKGTTCTLAAPTRRKFKEAYDALYEQLMTRFRAMETAIGYQASSRHDWVRNVLEPASPLTRGGRLNRWQTLVRNCGWKSVLTQLDVHERFPPNLLDTGRRASNQGRERLPNLLEELFGAARTSVDSEAPGSKLPEGVTVTSTAGGKLQVLACFNPRELLNKTQQNVLAKKGAENPTLLAMFKPLEHSRLCGFLDVPEAVSQVHGWLLERKAEAPALLAAFKTFEDDQERKELMAKVKRSFSAREQQLLADIYRAGVPAEA